jgi:nucleoside-diphosphate-sugar epimerase
VNILVTGASGFIGVPLCRRLLAAGHVVKAACSAPEQVDGLRGMVAADRALTPVKVARSSVRPDEWRAACRDVDAVVHLAGRAHRGDKTAAGGRETYRVDHLDVTRAVATAAIEMGAQHFIFASSVTVYGDHSAPGRAFREDSPVAPEASDPYALAKLEAERFLQTPGIRAAMATTIVRLPLVYGPGVKGNMLALLRLAARGLPLPLAGVDNRRSLLGLDNCVDFFAHVLETPAARNRVLLCSDGEDVSTPDIVRAICRGLGQKPRLFFVPPRCLRAVCVLAGQRARHEKLVADFQVAPAASFAALGFHPATGFAVGMERMCAWRRNLGKGRCA